MLTRKQKEELVKKESERVSESKTLVLTDFAGLSADAGTTLRKSLKELGGRYRVVKKRLLGRVFQEQGIELSPKELKGQVGVVFSPEGIAETSQAVYAFAKENKEKFRILGGVELGDPSTSSGNKVLSGEEVETIGNLPSREVLLGQLVGMMTYPLRSFIVVLHERGKTLEK